MAAREPYAPGRRARGGRRRFAVATVVAVRRPTSARPGASWDHPSGRHDRGLGRRQLRPARRRPRGAACAGRRPATPAPPVEGRTGRGTPRGRRHRARHDLPFRRDPGDLRGATCARPRAVGRRHDPDRRGARRARRRRRLAGDRLRPEADVGVPRRRARPQRDRPRRVRAGGRSVRRRRDPGDLGRGGARGAFDARRRVRRARRLAHAGADVRAWLRDEAGSPTSGSPRSARRRASTSGRRRRRRSRSRSSASSSRSAAGRAAFVAAPGPATLAGGAPDCTHRAGRGRYRAVDPVCGMTVDQAHARHLAEHDGVVYAFCRMGCRTAFIQEPGAYVPDRSLLPPTPAPERPRRRRISMQFSGHRLDRRAPRRRLGVPHGSQPGRQLRAGRGVDRGDRRRPLQGQGEGGGRVHLGPVHGRHDGRGATEPDLAILKAHGQAPGSAVDATADMRLSGPAGGARPPWTGRRTS